MDTFAPQLDEIIAYYKTELRALTVTQKYIYWLDLIGTMAFAWGFFIAAITIDSLLLTVLSSLFFYRGLAFVHEIVHQGNERLPGFRYAWDLLCGSFILFPSESYKIHLEHHKVNQFGTFLDPEYMPYADGHKKYLLISAAKIFIDPIYLALYPSVLLPLSFISKKFKHVLDVYLSNPGLNAFYLNKSFTKSKTEKIELTGCVIIIYAVIIAILMGLVSPLIILYWYVTMVSMFMFNTIRTVFCTHQYLNADPKDTPENQFKDSINLDNNSILSVLIVPVGLRFHALHHLFPLIPYHSLPLAHKKIMEKFPNNTLYKDTVIHSLFDGIKKFYRNFYQKQGA